MSSFRQPASGLSVAVTPAAVVAGAGAVGSDAFFADNFRHINHSNTPAADAGENLFQADRHHACW
jgi:hypothetical protein